MVVVVMVTHRVADGGATNPAHDGAHRTAHDRSADRASDSAGYGSTLVRQRY
jgi:hypothetical protein